jgi:hypothetical protein
LPGERAAHAGQVHGREGGPKLVQALPFQELLCAKARLQATRHVCVGSAAPVLTPFSAAQRKRRHTAPAYLQSPARQPISPPTPKSPPFQPCRSFVTGAAGGALGALGAAGAGAAAEVAALVGKIVELERKVAGVAAKWGPQHPKTGDAHELLCRACCQPQVEALFREMAQAARDRWAGVLGV